MPRDIIIVGQGVRLSNQIDAFKAFLGSHDIDFATTKMAIDVLPDHKYNKGMVGVRGNYKIPKGTENIYLLGTSLSLMTRGYNDELYDKTARVIRVKNVEELQSVFIR